MDPLLDHGRSAHRRREWREAYDALSEASAERSLAIGDLEALAESAWWLGKAKESLTLAEGVYSELVRAGEATRAGQRAIELALLWTNRGEWGIGSGWLNRARRTLGDLDDPAQGYLAYLDGYLLLEGGRIDDAVEIAARLERDAARFGSPILESMGLVLTGLGAIYRHRTAEGFACLDEAMLPVLADRLPPLWAGDIYCTVIHHSHRMCDVNRMRLWTDAMQRWCTEMSAEDTYSGVCRIHRLELQALDGGGPDLERRLADACTEIGAGNIFVAGAAYYTLGELRRVRGDAEGALLAYRRVREFGGEPQPGEALQQCADGQVESAWAALRTTAAACDELTRVRLLPALVRVALLRGASDAAESHCADLEQTAERYGSNGFRTWARHARGAVLVATGHPVEALTVLQDAVRGYREQHARYETAQVYECLAVAHRAIGDDDLAAADLATALAIYRQLGAEPDVRRMDSQPIGGLTVREAEILRLIASGATNREVAAAAFISEKTVSRHLANIYAKIGVTSRTAAAAWARDNGLI